MDYPCLTCHRQYDLHVQSVLCPHAVLLHASFQIPVSYAAQDYALSIAESGVPLPNMSRTFLRPPLTAQNERPITTVLAWSCPARHWHRFLVMAALCCGWQWLLALLGQKARPWKR